MKPAWRFVFILCVAGCSRVIKDFSVQRTRPVTPSLKVAEVVIAKSAGITAEVVQPIANLNYDWTVINGTVRSASRGPQITLDIGNAGAVLYTVTVSNAAGETAPPASASSQVLAGLPADYQPKILVASQVAIGRGPVPARIDLSIAGVTYTWASPTAALDSMTGTAITFHAQQPGALDLSATATVANAVGGAGATSHATVKVTAPYGALELVAGALGGGGYFDGPAAEARFPLSSERSVAADSDGSIWVAEKESCTLRRVVGGVVSTVAGAPGQCGIDTQIDGINATLGAVGVMAIDAQHNVVFADGDLESGSDVNAICPRLRQWNAASGHVKSLTPSISSGAGCVADLTRTQDLAHSSFGFIHNLGFDSSGDLYVTTFSALSGSEGTRRYPLHISQDAAAEFWLTTTAFPSATCPNVTAKTTQANAQPLLPQSTIATAFANGKLFFLARSTLTHSVSPPLAPFWPLELDFSSGSFCPYMHSNDSNKWRSPSDLAASALAVSPGGTAYFLQLSLPAGATTPSATAIVAYPDSVTPTVLAGGDAPGTADGSPGSLNAMTLPQNQMHPAQPLALVPSPIVGGEPTALIVSDGLNGTLREVSPLVGTSVITTLAGRARQSGFADGATSVARFNRPGAIAVDIDDSIYVADNGNGSLRAISADGSVRTIFGFASPGLRDGPASVAAIAAVTALTLSGNDLVMSEFNVNFGNVVRRYDHASGLLTTIHNTGLEFPSCGFQNSQLSFSSAAADGSVYATDDCSVWLLLPTNSGVALGVNGLFPKADLNSGFNSTYRQPRGVALDRAGTVWVSDMGGGEIRKLVFAGGLTVSTLTGDATHLEIVDGPCATAHLQAPRSIVAMPNGDLFFIDGRLVRRVANPNDTSCTVSTVAGNNDPARRRILLGDLPASLNQPLSIAATPSGDLIIVDGEEDAIVRLRVP